MPRVGRNGPDAYFAVAYDRWHALASLDPLAQAALLPTLPDWFPDVSDLFPAPDCEGELAMALPQAVFDGTPIPLTPLTRSRIVTGAVRPATSPKEGGTEVSREFLEHIAATPDAGFGAQDGVTLDEIRKLTATLLAPRRSRAKESSLRCTTVAAGFDNMQRDPDHRWSAIALRVAAPLQVPLTPSARAQVLSLIDHERESTQEPSARCRLLRERIELTDQPERLAQLLPLLPTIARGDDVRVHLSLEQDCAIRELRHATLDPDRLSWLLTAAELPAARVAPGPSDASWGPSSIVTEVHPEDLAMAASGVLVAHARWADSFANGAGWLDAIVRRYGEAPARPGHAPIPAYELDYDSGFPGVPVGIRAAETVLERWVQHDPVSARRWIQQLMDRSHVWLRAGPPTNTMDMDRFVYDQLAIARWAAQVGLRDDVDRYFAALRTELSKTPWPEQMHDSRRKLEDAITAASGCNRGENNVRRATPASV